MMTLRRTTTMQVFLVSFLFVLPISGFLTPLTKASVHVKHDVSPLFASIRFGAKTADEVDFIEKSLLANSLFSGIPKTNLMKMVNACEKKQAPKGEVIIRQGDSTIDGYVYLLAKGKCKVIVDGKEAPEPYGSIGEAFLFGEMGILYDETRRATIMVESDTATFYQILGTRFKSILNEPIENLATMKEIDAVINQISGTQSLYEGDIILPYKPERAFLWRQFDGTLLSFNLKTTLIMMGLSAAFIFFAREEYLELSSIKEIWDIQKALTTFVITFFVNQSFSFWRSVYTLARDIQGEIANYCLTLATNVEREESGELTDESRKFLEEIGQFIRIYHILMWASKAKRFKVLASPDGLKRMEGRGLMTKRQMEALQSMDLPNDELYHAPLEWMIVRSNQAMQQGILADDTATKGRLLEIASSMRVSAREVSDKISGRMPLAYVQLVQLLVDTFVISSPVALYASLGEASIIAVGLVTLFYTGLNNLAKIFLDPLNNEEFCENSIFMDIGVLIRETNSISTEYVKAGAKLPF